jgi:hypothetical protein
MRGSGQSMPLPRLLRTSSVHSFLIWIKLLAYEPSTSTTLRRKRNTSKRFLPQALDSAYGRASDNRSLASTDSATHSFDTGPRLTICQPYMTYAETVLSYTMRHE